MNIGDYYKLKLYGGLILFLLLWIWTDQFFIYSFDFSPLLSYELSENKKEQKH